MQHPHPVSQKKLHQKCQHQSSSNLMERSQDLYTVRVVSLFCYLELLYSLFRQTWTLQYLLKRAVYRRILLLPSALVCNNFFTFMTS